MNKSRRKEIRLFIVKLNSILNDIGSGMPLNMDLLNDIISDLECTFNDEECYRDNIPENLQSSCRYEAAEEACDNLENAVDALNYIEEDDSVEYIVGQIKETINYLNDAI